MNIDISECKKFWVCRKPYEPIDKFIAVHDINMLIGYVEQLQAKNEKLTTGIKKAVDFLKKGG